MAGRSNGDIPAADSQLWHLTAAICDDTITPAERDALERYLLDQPGARAFYIAYTRLHAQMLEEAGGETIDFLPEDGAEVGDPAAPVDSLLEKVDRQAIAEMLDEADRVAAPRDAAPTAETAESERVIDPPKVRRKKWDAVLPHDERMASTLSIPTSWTYGIAATIAAVAAVYFISSREPRNGPPVATLTAAIEAKWSDNAVSTQPGSRLAAGELHLVSGRVWIRLDDGPRVGVSAPATFALETGKSMRISQGRLVGYCDESADDLVVVTPSATIVDMGTEFGVDVQASGVTEVHTLSGKVAVRPVSADEGSAGTFELVAGQAGRIDEAGAVDLIDLAIDRFASIRPLVGRNLIVNGNFEADEPGKVIRKKDRSFDRVAYTSITGWDGDRPATTLQYNTPPPEEGTFFKPGHDPLPDDRDNCYFWGFKEGTTSQWIDVSALAGQIDAGAIRLELSGWIGGMGDGPDTLTVIATALDDQDQPLATAQLEPIYPDERKRLEPTRGAVFLMRTAVQSLPPTTRRIRIDLDSRVDPGAPWAKPDAYADNVSLTLIMK